jgi:hypothetical protein
MNPYPEVDGWYFDDLNRLPHGPYPTENEALWALLEHMREQRLWRENVDARRKSEGKD